MAAARIDSQQVLDAALAVAASRHWEAVRLHEVAERLGIGLAELQPLVAEKEDLVDLLWERADRHMLQRCQGEDFLRQPFVGRFEACVMSWLEPLAPHRRTVAEMLLVRLEPGHLHIQLPTLLRISRSVQWMRELCGREATFARRAAEEVVLSGLFVAAVAGWLRDASPAAARTRERLRWRLRLAAGVGHLWPGAG